MRRKRAVSPVVSTLILIVVAVGAVTGFAYILAGFQSQNEKENDLVQNAKNEDLQVASLQLYPPNWNTVNVTGMNMTIRNLNTQESGLVGVEINGIYTAFDSIGNSSLSPFSVLSNGIFVPVNQTQIILGKQSLQLEVNLSTTAFQQPFSRMGPISINLLTSAQNVFTFSINPPVADFNAQDIGSGNDLLNASGSFSPDTGIQDYTWNFVALNNMSGVSSTSPTLSGQFVQYFPITEQSLVTLTVVDDYGLVGQIRQIIPNTVTSNLLGGFPSCSTYPSIDMNYFVCPYFSNLERIREVLMNPYSNCAGQNQCYGYDDQVGCTTPCSANGPYGMTCGGNVEPSPAIAVQNGYNNICVVTDNNIEGGNALDYFNGPNSPLANLSQFSAFNSAKYGTSIALLNMTSGITYLTTNICCNSNSSVRTALSGAWWGYGPCYPSTPTFQYPFTGSGPDGSTLVDRREGEYGFSNTFGFASGLVDGNDVLGGIGALAWNNNNCATNPPPDTPNRDDGQIWYLNGYNSKYVANPLANPLIVTEMPGTPITANSNLEELSFYIDVQYMKCIAQTAPCTGSGSWEDAYVNNAMTQFPFQAPRQALHFIQVTRATRAWNLTGITVDGLTPLQMLEIAIAQVFTPATEVGPMGVGGAIGPDGGLYQQWGGGGSPNTPEPNMQAMIAFDPDMPNWFTQAACTAAGIPNATLFSCINPPNQ